MSEARVWKKRERREKRGIAQPAARPSAWSWARRSAIVAAVVASTFASFFVFDRFVFAKISDPLVGKWGVDGGEQDGATLELRRNGAFRATVNLHGSEGTVSGRLEAGDRSLTFISVNPNTGQEDSIRKTIELVAADQLMLREPTGQIMKLVRLD